MDGSLDPETHASFIPAMNRVLVPGRHCLALLAAICFLPPATAPATPRIACDEPVFQFGTRDSSETVEHSFELKNTGTSDLAITAIRPACGCTATELTRPTIPPGETAKISTKLTLAGRSGEARKTIAVESNDPANPTIVLAMEGKIATEFEVAPPVFTLRQPAASQPATGSVQITPNNHPFRITGSQSSDPSVRISTGTGPDGRSHQITATLEKLTTSDPQPFLVTLQTDSPRVPTIDIPAVVVLEKKILVAPEKILLREGDAETKKYVLLKSAEGTPLEIKEISTPAPAVKVDYSATPSSIRLAVRGLSDLREYDGKAIVVIFTNGESIQIPVVFESR